MARPKVKKAMQRKTISVSLRGDTLVRAKATGNSSRYFEQATDGMLEVSRLVAEAKAGSRDIAAVIEDMEDVVDSWMRIGEPTMSAAAVRASLPPRSSKARNAG